MDFSFKKEERIHKRDDLTLLFEKGNSFLIHPFKVLYLESQDSAARTNDPSFLKFGVSIPKRKFKRAVDRNLLKRRVKEAYRLNRNGLKTQLKKQNKYVSFMVIYVDNSILEFSVIEPKIILILQRLQAIYAENH